jgi:hypothetical protein
MNKSQELLQLKKMIALSNGWPVAKAFEAYVLGGDDKSTIASKAVDVLRIFPTMPGACALMSAIFAAHLERTLQPPILVVAGTLSIKDQPVFGDGKPFDGNAVFSKNDLDWDGHVWVMIGQYIADISIFRTAYSTKSPPLLANHINSTFGSGRGLYLDRWRNTRRLGIGYHPQYVLTYDQVTSLMKGAEQIIKNQVDTSMFGS